MKASASSSVVARRARKVAALERRLAYIARRLDEGLGDTAYQRAEAGALRYAISIVRAAIDEDVIDDLEHSPNGIAA